jgi:hypothetical protein
MSISPVYPGTWASHQASDPFFSDVVNLSHFDGTNGSTTFTDSSSLAHNLTLVAGANAAISTTAYEFGGSSLRTNKTSNGITATNTAYSVGTQDYTVEWWMNADSTAEQDILFISEVPDYGFYNLAGGDIHVYLNTVDRIVSGTALVAGAWTFCAYSRHYNATSNFYINGSSVGSWTDNLNINVVSPVLYLGGYPSGTFQFSGYIDDFRFTIGKARYSGSTCPVPTAAFPNHS